MACANESFTEEARNNSSTFEVDLSKAASDSKAQNWDSSSLYQVKKFVTNYNNEKTTMFEYFCLDLSKSNQETQKLKNKIESLRNDPLISEKSLSLMSSKF